MTTLQVQGEDLEIFGTTCQSCSVPLEVPWIRCVKCQPNVDLCARCFSYGVELGQHENDHPYCVVKFDFPLYEASWTASEEMRLLDAILEYGFGNWPAVSSRMRTKSANECERHYLNCYVDNPQAPLPDFQDAECINKGAPVTFKLSENPPRPADGTALWVEMGGYSAARSEFNVEYDNFVEMEICHMNLGEEDDKDNSMQEEEDDDKVLYRDLNLAALEVYRNCLIERQRRKHIVRENGLINLRKWYGMLKRRFDSCLSFDYMRPFMRLFPSITFDKYLESLLYEKQLKLDISKLQEYRRNGIVRLRSVKHYFKLKHSRDQVRGQRHLLSDVLNHLKDEVLFESWLVKQAALESSSKGLTHTLPQLYKKPVPRLQIDCLPGYDKLNELEKELCAEVRLVPQAYLDFSKILINECTKHGFLRLAQARTLIKIDVNKTRKLFDFLVLHRHINKEPASDT
ncbi:unnamed protein product [Lymnaea stagnalis]|uniref:Transcriptional adapter n=1 Tax=Lymnaea stagnalis TaxID=6523 RepID=A0AAV2HDT7_LYMST